MEHTTRPESPPIATSDHIERIHVVWSAGFLMATLFLAAYAISLLAPLASDYYLYYHPALISFMGGRTALYDTSSPPFYNIPWLLGFWMPFAGLPYLAGQFVNTLLILICIFMSLWILRGKTSSIGVLLAVFGLPCSALIVHGQIDGFVLLGITLGYVAVGRKNTWLLSVALCLLAIRPVSVILVGLWFLFALRDWKVLLLPTATVVLLGFFIGLDWPIRYLVYTIQHPLDAARVEVWRYGISPLLLGSIMIVAVIAFAFLIRRRGFDDSTFALALATNVLFSPYLLWAHYVALIPALLILAQEDLKYAIPVYLSSFLLPWLGTAYPIAMFIALWLTVLKPYCHPIPCK